MLPMLAITKGKIAESLVKFQKGNESYSLRSGGWKENAKSKKRYVTIEGNQGTVLAEHPPHYFDPDSGHIIAAGMCPHTCLVLHKHVDSYAH